MTEYSIQTMLDAVKNFGKVTVSIGYTNVDNVIVLTSGDGAKLPSPSTDGEFNLTWWNSTDYSDPADDPNKEIVRVTTRAGDVLTVARGQEGISASVKNLVGKTYKMILAVTAKMIPDIQSDAQTRANTTVESHRLTGTHVLPQPTGVLDPSSMFPQDMGKNWQDLGVISASVIQSMSYLGNGIVIFGDATGHIFRSTDFGATWTDLGVISTSVIRSISYLGNGIAVFGDNAFHIFRSTDFGATWTDLGVISTSNIRSISYLGNGIAIFGDEAGHIFRSTDFGATWTDLGVISTSIIRSISYLGNGIAVFGDNAFHIFRSTDFGATWTDLGVFGTRRIISSSYLGNGIAVFGSESSPARVFRSIDFGATWNNLGAIGTNDINAISYLGNGIAVFGNEDNHIFRSTDFGATWTDLGVISSTSIRLISYLGNGIVVFSDQGGHIWRSDIAYKLDEAQVNFPRLQTDVTASRLLNTTYTNNDKVRTLHIVATVRCVTTVTGGEASAQGKSDALAVPTTAASGIAGIRVGLLNEDNSYEVSFYVMPGKNYRIDSTTVNGTVTLGKWFETLI